MNSFATIQRFEDDVFETCQLISDNLTNVDDEGLYALIEQLVDMAQALNHFAAHTDEWSCFACCQDYREQLRAVYDALNAQFEQR